MSRQHPIIVIGSGLDPVFAGTVQRLQALDIDHCTINLDENWLEYVAFDVALDGRGALPYGNRICVGDRTIALSEIRGMLLRFLAWAPPGMLKEPEGMFISSELSALFRFLSHELRCPVINRLRPDLWAFHVIEGAQLKSMVPVQIRVPAATVYASTVDPPGATRECHVPFSQPDTDFLVDGLPSGALERIVKTVPLRLMSSYSDDEVETYVVGDAVHGSVAPDGPIAAASREVAHDLDVAFCRIAWATGDDGVAVLRRVYLFPVFDSRSGPLLKAVCDSLVHELSR